MEDILQEDNSTNVTFSPTLPSDGESISEQEAALTIVSLSFVIMAAIFGNLLVIIAVFNYRPLRNVQNMFIVSLAAADIGVAVIVMPLNVAYSIMNRWIYGGHVCKMWLTCDVLFCTASILNLCAIALDRYWAIHDPIDYAPKRTLKRVLFKIAILWSLSLLISSPPLMGWNDWPPVFTEDTECMLTQEQGYVLYSGGCAIFIPMIIMIAVYIKIFIAAKQRLGVKSDEVCAASSFKRTENHGISHLPLMPVIKEVSSSEINEDTTSTSVTAKISDEIKDNQSGDISDSDATQEVPKDSSRGITIILPRKRNTSFNSSVRHYMREKQKISLSKERRAARVLGIVMGAFLVCWIPFLLMYIILAFCTEQCYLSPKVVNFIVWLGYVNSALNPIIYTIFNPNFRRAFARILFKKK